MVNDYDDIIVDVGGRDTTSQRSALTIADLFLIPFKPRSIDIWTIGGVKTMISEIKAINQKLISVALINQADAKGQDNKDAIDVISECPDLHCIPLQIGYRKAFGNAASEGLGVIELKVEDKKAVQEIKDLYEHLYNTYLSRTLQV
jgi:chromosome partitioning protein